jgi:hypothetical protein
MNAIVVRDNYGVLLRYGDPGDLRDVHRQRKPQPSDRQRISLLKGERELLTLRIIADHLDLSDIALTRIDDALEAIRVALEFKRRDYGMSVTKADEAA